MKLKKLCAVFILLLFTAQVIPASAALPAYNYVDLPKVGDVWSSNYLKDYYADIIGPEIFDPATRDQFCEAFFFGGNTLRVWNEATDLKKNFLQGSSLANGQKVLLVGKFIDESGLTAVIKSLIGPTGELTTIPDISHYNPAENKRKPTWQFRLSC
jgi:hypothetical protein